MERMAKVIRLNALASLLLLCLLSVRDLEPRRPALRWKGSGGGAARAYTVSDEYRWYLKSFSDCYEGDSKKRGDQLHPEGKRDDLKHLAASQKEKTPNGIDGTRKLGVIRARYHSGGSLLSDGFAGSRVYFLVKIKSTSSSPSPPFANDVVVSRYSIKGS